MLGVPREQPLPISTVNVCCPASTKRRIYTDDAEEEADDVVAEEGDGEGVAAVQVVQGDRDAVAVQEEAGAVAVVEVQEEADGVDVVAEDVADKEEDIIHRITYTTTAIILMAIILTAIMVTPTIMAGAITTLILTILRVTVASVLRPRRFQARGSLLRTIVLPARVPLV